MKSEKLLYALGNIDEKYIEEAAPILLAAHEKPITTQAKQDKLRQAKRSSRLFPFVAAAACLAFVVSTLLLSAHLRNISNPGQPGGNDTGLAKLEVVFEMDGMGFEGYMAYNIDELSNGNPWSENDVIETLPVFENPTLYDRERQMKPIRCLSAAEMIAIARQTAGAMGLTVDSVYTTPTEDDLQNFRNKTEDIEDMIDETPQMAIAQCGDSVIEVDLQGRIRVTFRPTVSLPDKYSFTDNNTTQQQAEDTALYLLDKYAAAIGMQSPALALSGTYTYEAKKTLSYEAYESSGNIIERILGYNFNRVQFIPDRDNTLQMINRHFQDLSHKIGDYPIITAQTARELLLEKQYTTSVPEEFPGEQYIARIELVYHTGMFAKVYMPFYRFLVEMPTMQIDNGLKTFGAFYVPAIDREFLYETPEIPFN
jgi:hypothetical protein